MKKRILIIGLILLLACPSFGFEVIGSGTVASVDYSHILFWTNAESGTVDQDANYTLSSANGEYPNGKVGTDNSVVTIKSDWYKTGAQSFYSDTSTDFYSFPVSSDDIADDSIGTIAFWFKIGTGTWAGSGALMRLNVSAGGYAIIRLSGTDEIEVRYNDGSISTTICVTDTANLAEETDYWAEFRWDDVNNTRRLVVYNSSLVELDNKVDTDAFSWSDFSSVDLPNNSSALPTIWEDQIIITNRITGETGYANTASCPRN